MILYDIILNYCNSVNFISEAKKLCDNLLAFIKERKQNRRVTPACPPRSEISARFPRIYSDFCENTGRPLNAWSFISEEIEEIRIKFDLYTIEYK